MRSIEIKWSVLAAYGTCDLVRTDLQPSLSAFRSRDRVVLRAARYMSKRIAEKE